MYLIMVARIASPKESAALICFRLAAFFLSPKNRSASGAVEKDSVDPN
jgi:hypothetical protein